MKENLEQTRVIKRRYPKIVIGSKVRLHYKKDVLDKERTPLWSDTIYTVVDLTKDKNQTFYKINNGNGNDYIEK